MFDIAIRDGVLQAAAPDVRWLSMGWDGGFRDGGAAYNVTVPDDFTRRDLSVYISNRLEDAGFSSSGPALLTGVAMENARGASLGPVNAITTVGLSNPASLPLREGNGDAHSSESDTFTGPGTVNLIVGTGRKLDETGLLTLLGEVVEAKTGTLLPTTGFTGTTSDGVIVGSDRTGKPAQFAGSSTEVGDAARGCVRDAILAALDAQYPGSGPPASVAAARDGVVTS
ncbi:MAG: adenosylcobinamide amidohydrolase, partial [Halanaeroarchaeum sp.]